MAGRKVRIHFILVCIALCALSISSARAALVVDTGPGSTFLGGLSLIPDQWLAGRFELDDAYTITSVEGWFRKNTEGTATAAIYSDSGTATSIPGSEIFSAAFLLDAPQAPPHDWDGAYSLDWALGAGTYWLAFEIRSGQTARGSMPSGTAGAPNPLANYALSGSQGVNWLNIPNSALGMRIDAELSTVPVPAALWLFGSVLVGLVAVKKRRVS